MHSLLLGWAGFPDEHVWMMVPSLFGYLLQVCPFVARSRQARACWAPASWKPCHSVWAIFVHAKPCSPSPGLV